MEVKTEPTKPDQHHLTRFTNGSLKLLVVHRTNMKTYGDRAFSIAGPKLWNQLPLSIRELSSIDSFKKSLKTYLFRLAYS